MIKFSALLVALAIGLLAAGVAASSLLLVYVAIGVCLVSAVLLAVGVVRHWAEIFGSESRVPAAGTVPGTALLRGGRRAVRGRASRGDSRGRGSGSGNRPRRGGGRLPGRSRPAGTGGGAGRRAPGGWSRDGGTTAGPVTGPVRGDRSRREDRRPGREDKRPGRREERRPRRKDTGGRPGQAPGGARPSPACSSGRRQSGHPAPPDDLWERVAEELESAGKRDTGDLAWPAAEFPLPPEPAAPAVPAWPGEPRGSSGTGWPDGPERPPGFGDPAFPSRAATPGRTRPDPRSPHPGSRPDERPSEPRLCRDLAPSTLRSPGPRLRCARLPGDGRASWT